MRIRVDASRPLAEEPTSGHNRWHPDLEAIASVAVGEELTIECRDGLDGQITPDSTPEDVLGMSLGLGHPMTGPIHVEGAEPGDVLEVELLAYEHADVGIAALIPGFGFLSDLFPDPYVAGFRLADGVARSDKLPGIAIPADMFAGNVGVAPSHALMKEQRAREEELKRRGGAVADDLPHEAVPAAAAAGVRTIPPRENGGNLDCRGLVAGSRLYLTVHVPGALFSIGDLHFAQGDGETCGTGIEMAGAVTVRFGLRKQPRWRPRFPAYETPPRPGRRELGTTGISLTDAGRNESMDLGLATRQALLAMIDYLTTERGLTAEAAYVLISCCVDLRLSEVVDVPNPLVSAVLPLEVFES